MTSEQRAPQSIMRSVNSIIKDDDYDSVSEDSYISDPDINVRLLGFCLRYMKCNVNNLDKSKSENFSDLLNFNDIYHRKVTIPGLSSLKRDEYPLLVVFLKQKNDPIAIYRKGRSNWIYSPIDNSHKLASEYSFKEFEKIAIEIYASLPPKVSNISQILEFVIASQYPAIGSYLLASLLLSAFNLSIPLFTNMLVSRILPYSNYNLLLQASFTMMLILFSLSIFQYLRSQMSLRLETVANFKLQPAAWDRFMKLPMENIWKYTTADLASRVDAISQLRALVGTSTLTSVTESIFGVSFVFLMFRFDASLTIPAVGLSILAIVGIFFLARKAISLQLPLAENAAELTNFSFQALLGLPQIRSSAAEPFLLLRWLEHINLYSKLQLKDNLYNNLLEILSISLTPISTLLMFSILTLNIFSSTSVDDLNSIVASFIAFNSAYAGFNGSIVGLGNQIASTLGAAAVLWKRASSILYAPVESGYNPESSKKQILGNFKINNISFKYPESDNNIFKDFNLSINAKQHTAITGMSGCGKTTLVKLILGFISPDSGEIIVDGTPLHQLSIRTYRRQLGVVMQNMLLSGTIREIVSSGISYSDEKIWDALEGAAISDDISKMPMKLNTILNQTGSSLSGGQMQRLSIARAIIRQPKVLIMDEATSALDNKSQKRVTQTIENLGATRITIAHRLSTIANADLIVLFRPGKYPIQGVISDPEISEYFKN